MDYYFLPQPPYFLVFAGLFIGITCGAAFEASLKQVVNNWYKNKGSDDQNLLKSSSLQIPFIGICVGICLFLLLPVYLSVLPAGPLLKLVSSKWLTIGIKIRARTIKIF